jgi:hypothetical protein
MAWPLRELVTEFKDLGLAATEDSANDERGSRRHLIERFHTAIDFRDTQSVQKALAIYAQVVRARVRASAEHSKEPEAVIYRDSLDKLLRCLQADGYGYERGIIRPESAELRLAFLLRDCATNFSENGLRHLVERLEALANDDPALAVAAARDVCETCCGFILAERSADDELPRSFAALLNRTLEQLQLLPEQVKTSGRRAPPVRRVLETVSELCEGLDALSALYAKPNNGTGLSSRHARLAIDAAGTLARFLLATHLEKTCD